MARFLLLFILEIAAGTAVLIWLIAHPAPWTGAVLPAAMLALVAGILATAFHLLWRPMLAAYPARDPAPDAVRRRFQSFGIGIVNMGFSIHVAADAEYLHLTPLAPWQWLGARPASIPWSALEPVGHRGGVARLDGRRFDGPAWCIDLARTGAEES